MTTFNHTPFQLRYELHPPMPIKYLAIAPTTIEIFIELIKVLSSRITKLEKLSETKLETSIIINKKQ